MFDDLIPVVFCVLATLVVGLFILPIIALAKTRRIDEVLRRLSRIERELDVLRTAQSLKEEVPRETVEERQPEAPAIVEANPIDPFAADLSPTIERPRFRRTARPIGQAPVSEWSDIDWEAWLGARGLGWAAVVLLLLATAFFFRELFERNLIGPLGRVSIGLSIGCAACIAGYRQHRKGWPILSQMLTAAGIALIYLSTFASFGYYKLLDPNPAGVFLTLVIALAFGLALAYDARAIALMATIGGLLNPILLDTGEDRYVGLFTYLVILNAGVAGVLLVRRWRVLGPMAVVGAHILFWMWYDRNFHPSKLSAAVAFHLSLTGLWIVQQILGPMARSAKLTVDEAVRIFVQAILLAAAGYWLLHDDYRPWIGSIALAAAIVHTGLTWLALRRRPDDPIHAMCEWTIAMGYLAAVMPLQATAPWVAVCWAVQGLALWRFSLAIRSIEMRVMGFALLAMAVGRFAFWQSIEGHWNRLPFVPILNAFALSGLAVAAACLVAAVMSRRAKPSADSPDFLLGRIVGLGGLFLIWVVLSFEAHDYFSSQRNLPQDQLHAALLREGFDSDRADIRDAVARRDLRLARSSQVALSITWGLYALVLMALGLRLPSRPLRWSALALFGVTLVKVIVLDMERLPGLYRVAAFFGLSLLMGAAAWSYQKVKLTILTSHEENDHAGPI
jgi:uncharacterized membrane protein